MKKARPQPRLFHELCSENIPSTFMNQEAVTQLIQIFTLADADATQRVSQRLTLVLEEPAAYQSQFAGELAERGIEDGLPAQELRDVALIDALLSEDLLWESDWQDNAADTAEGLNDILAQQNRPQKLSSSALAGNRKAGPEMLDAIQEALEPLGLALVLFTLDSDSFPLSVVAEEKAEGVRRLAQELGFTLTVY
jgi:hypothetical protein